MNKPKIMEGSQRALEGYEADFAVKNVENQKKPFEQRYQESIAQCEAENKALEAQIAQDNK